MAGYYFTNLLVSTAEVSNLMSFLSVLGGLLVMFIFLMRLIYQDIADGGGRGVTSITQTAAQTLMSRVSVPFSVCLSDSVTETRAAKLQISSNVRYHIRAFWGVDIPTFHHVLRAPWTWLQEAFLRGRLFGDNCVDYGGVQVNRGPHEERCEQVVRRGVGKLDLGPAPRDVYPLVVVLIRADGDNREDMTEVTGLLCVIHLKDEECPIPSQVLVTYLRQGSSVTLLRPLYLSEGGESSDTESAEGSDTEQESPRFGSVARCVVCQLERVTRVSLPCRHAVTCRDCFNRCQNRCPMCRGYVSSYFLLSPESTPVTESDSNKTDDHEQGGRGNTWGQMWNRWNTRVNNMMGLRENI